MHTMVRNHLTAAFAATTAGAVVLSLAPVTPIPDVLRPTTIQTAEVQLLASPLDAYVQLISNTLGSIGTLAQRAVTPSLLPIAGAVLQNQVQYAQAIGSGIQASAVNTVDQLFNELPAATVQAINQFFTGDPLGTATTVVDAFSAFLLGTFGPIIGTTTSVLSTIAFRADQAFETAISFGVVGVLEQGLLSPAYSAVLAIGQAAQNVVDAVGGGDFLGAIGETIAAPAVVADGFLNGITVGSTHYGGLLSPLSFTDLSTGPFGALIFARNEIASALSGGSMFASRSVADATVNGPTVTLSTTSQATDSPRPQLKRAPAAGTSSAQSQRQKANPSNTTRVRGPTPDLGVERQETGQK